MKQLVGCSVGCVAFAAHERADAYEIVTLAPLVGVNPSARRSVVNTRFFSNQMRSSSASRVRFGLYRFTDLGLVAALRAKRGRQARSATTARGSAGEPRAMREVLLPRR